MKMMKKALMILAVAALVLSMAGGVAAEIVYEDMLVDDIYSATPVPVTLTLNQSFEVTLPVSFSFTVHEDGYYADNEPFTVDVHRLNKTAMLYVNVSSPNYYDDGKVWNLTSDVVGLPEISYNMGVTTGEKVHLSAGGPFVYNNTAIFNSTAPGASENAALYLHAKIPVLANDLEVTGKYTDVLTFTVEIKED